MTLSNWFAFRWQTFAIVLFIQVDLTSSLTKNHKSAENIYYSKWHICCIVVDTGQWLNVSAVNGLLNSMEIALHCKILIFISIEMDSATNALWQLIYGNFISRIIKYSLCIRNIASYMIVLFAHLFINLIFRIQFTIERALQFSFVQLHFNNWSKYIHEIIIDV